MTTYNEMPTALKNKERIKGNSVTAYYDSVNHRYMVDSYATRIFEIKGQMVEYFDNTFYSITTSKLQNMLIDTFKLGLAKKRDDKKYNWKIEL
jgi:hypothetical protein